MKHLIFCFLIFCCLTVRAQVPEGQDTVSAPAAEIAPRVAEDWATPGVTGDRPSKGIVISYNLITPYDITSNPVREGLGGASSRVTRLEQMEFSMRIPITWKGRTKIVTGINYLYEEYHFENPEQLEYDFYTNLEDRHLNSLGFTAFILHSLDNRRFLGSRLSFELNGDYQDSDLPIMQQGKASGALLYGWRPNAYTAYGFGGYYSYTFGRPSVYPVFLWSKTFNRRWGIEAVLPANFRVRHNFSQKSILLAGARVTGYSYHILSKNPPLSNYPYLELRNSNVLGFLEFEQEIYSFLWFGVTVGYRYSINFNVSEENSFSNDRIIENKVGHSPYFNVSLFAVPPRNLLKRQ